MLCTRVRLFTDILFPRHEGAGIVSMFRFGPTFYRRTDSARSGLAITIRVLPTLVAAIMIGPLAYGSPACMTASEAHAKFPKAHLYWHGSEHCWIGLAAVPVHSPRPTLAAVQHVHSPRPALVRVPLPSPRPALATVPAASPHPKIVSSAIDGGRVTEVQCRYSPCE